MSALEWPEIHGYISAVPLSTYEQIIEAYLKKVSSVPGVLGVTQIGSVSTPGLSDIDLVVTISDNPPWPKWGEISLAPIAANIVGGEVVLHDIFVLPRSIARSVEGFFFVDQQNVLLGERLGGVLDASDIGKFRKFLIFEYAFHRLESLANMLLIPRVPLRDALLLVSTTRHSINLAVDLEFMGTEEAQLLLNEISELRELAIVGDIGEECFAQWPERMIQLMWRILQSVGAELTSGMAKPPKNCWRAGPKMAAIDVFSGDEILSWRKVIAAQRGSRLSSRVKIIPAPPEVHCHIAGYLGLENQSGSYLANNFPGIGKILDPDSDRNRIRTLRAGLVVAHWDFISRAGYLSCSGKGYLGINMPRKKRWRDHLISTGREIQLLKATRVIGTRV